MPIAVWNAWPARSARDSRSSASGNCSSNSLHARAPRLQSGTSDRQEAPTSAGDERRRPAACSMRGQQRRAATREAERHDDDRARRRLDARLLDQPGEPAAGRGPRDEPVDGRAAGPSAASSTSDRRSSASARRPAPTPRAAAARCCALREHAGRYMTQRRSRRAPGRRRATNIERWRAPSPHLRHALEHVGRQVDAGGLQPLAALRPDAGRAEAADHLAVLRRRPASRTRRSPAW